MSTLFKNTTISFKWVKCLDFGGFHDYLENPPWLGPTKKILKIEFQRLAKNQSISRDSRKKLPDFSLTFEVFYKNSLTFPGFP